MTTLRTRPTMQQWVDEYISRQAAAGAAKRTLHMYRHVLNRLAKWVDETERIDPRELTPEHLDDWWYSPEGLNAANRELKPPTWNQYRSTVRTFTQRYLDRWRLVNDPRGLGNAIDPANARRYHKEKIWLSQGQMEEIIASADHPWMRIILALMCLEMPRQSHVRALRRQDVDTDAGKIFWWNEKKGQPLPLPMMPRTAQEIRDYLSWFHATQGTMEGDMFFVPGRMSNGLPEAGREKFKFAPYRKAGDLARPIAKYTDPFLPEGIAYDGRSHCLRRSSAELYLRFLEEKWKAGVTLPNSPIEIVRARLGHDMIETTLGYLDRSKDSLILDEAARLGDFLPEPGPASDVVDLEAARAARAG